MEDARRNVLVGLFVVLGLAAFAGLIVMFGKVPFWAASRGSYPLEMRFNSVAGVRDGTMVTLAGKPIGRVSSVEFVDPARIERGVRVIASIESRYRVPKGARAQTSEAILGMGRPPIEIEVDRPTDDYQPLDEPITGHTTAAVETLFPSKVVTTITQTAAQLGDAAAALTPVLGDLHDLLEHREVRDVDEVGVLPGNLSTVSERLDTLLRHFNEIVGDPAMQSHLRDGIANFHAITEQGKTAAERINALAQDARTIAADVRAVVGKAGAAVDNLDQRSGAVAQSLADNLDKSSRILDDVAAASGQVRRGEGTVGKLVSDDRLYESMVLTFQRLTETLAEFKALVKDWQQGKIRVAL